jgi:hypothetical protein
MNMEEIRSSETSADFHQTIRRYIPQRCENIKSNKIELLHFVRLTTNSDCLPKQQQPTDLSGKQCFSVK